jgi:DNA-binding response OmpR family regulator
MTFIKQGNQRTNVMTLHRVPATFKPAVTPSLCRAYASVEYLPPRRAASDSAHILAIDADLGALKRTADYLVEHDMRVTSLPSSRGLDELVAKTLIDLVVLDVSLPGEDGLQIARSLRERSDIPIILLSGHTDEADRVMGLEMGADDFVTKPFSPRELLARIRALLRRARSHETVPAVLQRLRGYRFAGWELNVRLRRLISPQGEPVHLTNHEFNLLAAFLAAPQRLLTRGQLIGLSRLHDDEVYDRSIDVQVLRLRKKIPCPHDQPFIRTERGAGYIFTADVQTVR